MQQLGTKTLETDRLILRPFAMADAEAMWRNWASDPEVTKFLTWPAHESVDVSKMVLSDWTSQYERPDYYQWAIVPKDLMEPIGSMAVVHQNEKHQRVEIGYCIGKNWWRRGYTSEALSRLVRFFFEELEVRRVEARHDPHNPGSGAVMRKSGMHYEGTLRQYGWNNQGICDEVVYSILREEHEA